MGKEVFMYAGKIDDSATGLYYFGARYYDTTTGRFITQDTYQGSKNDPMSLNRYVYARDNPEKMVDPSGHLFVNDFTDYLLSAPAGVSTSTTTSLTATSSGSVTTYTETTTTTTITCDGGYCTTTTHSDFKTWMKAGPRQAGTGMGGAAEPTIGLNQYANTPTNGIGGGPTSASLQIDQPVCIWGEIVHAAWEATQVYPGSYNDAVSGHFTLSDALGVGFVTVGIIALPFAFPVGIGAIAFGEFVYEAGH